MRCVCRCWNYESFPLICGSRKWTSQEERTDENYLFSLEEPKTQGVKTLMCGLSYLDASLKDYDLINKFFFKKFILASFLFRVQYLYIPGVSTSSFRVLYLHFPGYLPLYSRFRILISFLKSYSPLYSGFPTHIFLVIYLCPLHSGFSTSLIRFLPLYSGFSILGLFQTPHPGAELQAGFSINPASQSPSISVSQSAGFSAYKITHCTDYG